jgi:hypothetical protein
LAPALLQELRITSQAKMDENMNTKAVCTVAFLITAGAVAGSQKALNAGEYEQA